jgi:hypothetical protein
MALRRIAKLALVGGLLGGPILCGYAAFHGGLGGPASAGCHGDGCEDRISARRDHDEALLELGAFGGGGLIVAGTLLLIVLAERERAAAGRPSLPEASVRRRRRDREP